MTDISSLKTDDFALYGTAVEQIEGDDVSLSKPVPIQEQIATDEKGRRRFHGAFTGGFSAGHFNTVGSIEGWTPRTFQSSRQKRKSMDQRPEDYMDTEDFAAHGIAPKKVQTKDAFASRAAEGNKRKYGVSGPDRALRDLVAPLNESFGAMILKKMGWKPGQGIGPRLTKREKHVRAMKNGLNPVGTIDDAKEEDRRAEGKLFAPDDVIPVQLSPKSNFHGIGYRGLDISTGLLAPAAPKRFSLFDEPASVLSIGAPTASAKVKKKGMTGQAFGVGAFEEDDEDIYSADDMSRYDKTLGGIAKDSSKKEELKAIEAPGAPRILEGFERGSFPLHQSKVYPPPEVPKTFNGLHSSQNVVGRAPSVMEVGTGANRHHHDAKSRSALMDEESLKAPVITSVFDLIPANQKNRIPIFQRASEPETTAAASVVRKEDLVRKIGIPGPTAASVEEQRRNNLALFAGSVTMESKMTFRPFDKEPLKQQRYELFLKRRSEKNKEAIEEVWMDVGSSMTEWEREREKGEFFRAAALYRPMSGLMAARFTRAQTEEVSNEVEVSVDTGDVTKERKAAVEKKTYGASTRDVFEWHPDRLVCKRFNVPNPYPTSTLVGILTVKRDKFSLFNFLNVPGTADTGSISTEELASKSDNPVDSAAVEPLQPEKPVQKLIMPERLPALVLPAPVARPSVAEVPTERPPMDIFRAIFESSDVEEANDAEPDLPLIPPAPTQSNADPIKTLFEIDSSTRTLEKKEYSVVQESPSVIGPARPPPELLAAYASVSLDPSESSEAPERRKAKHKKLHKPEKKKKKHKEKKRRKEKSRSNRDDDSDTSSSDEKNMKLKSKLPVETRVSARHENTVSSDEDILDERKLLHKLKNAVMGKRLTASDFM